MAKTNTTLQGLRNILFDQLEAITNPDLTGDALAEEIERSQAVTKISAQIIDSAELELSALKYADNAVDFGFHTDVKRITGGDTDE